MRVVTIPETLSWFAEGVTGCFTRFLALTEGGVPIKPESPSEVEVPVVGLFPGGISASPSSTTSLWGNVDRPLRGIMRARSRRKATFVAEKSSLAILLGL